MFFISLYLLCIQLAIGSVESVQKDVIELEDMFAKIEDSAFDIILDKEITVNEIRVGLKEVLEEIGSEIGDDLSSDAIWRRLSTHWHFNNLTLLERLIYKYGDETLKAFMQNYSRKLEEFRCKTRLSNFAMYSIKIGKNLPDEEFSDFVIELDQSPDNYTLKKLHHLQESLTYNLSLPPWTLILQSIKLSDFKVTVKWAVPARITVSLKEHNIMGNASVMALCKAHQILCITVDGKRHVATPDYLRGVSGGRTTRTIPKLNPGRQLSKCIISVDPCTHALIRSQ